MATARNIFQTMIGGMLFAGLTLAFSEAGAQAFYKKIQVAQLDMGFGGYYRQVMKTNREDSLENHLKTTRMASNSYSLHYEVGVKEWRKQGAVGVGGFIGIRKIDARNPDETLPIRFREVWLRYYQVGVEGRYHFYTRSRWDPYAGVMLGIQLREYKTISFVNTKPTIAPQLKNSRLTFGGQICLGARYYVYNNIAFFGEAGFGVFYAKLGVNLIIVP